jgi:hypothetical protein
MAAIIIVQKSPAKFVQMQRLDNWPLIPYTCSNRQLTVIGGELGSTG